MNQDFFSPQTHGFVRVAVATPTVTVAEPQRNCVELIRIARNADAQGCAITLFPELSLSAYTNDDLFFQSALLDSVLQAIESVRHASEDLSGVLIAGAPLRHRHRLYNTAVVFHRGRVLGVVPKVYIPNYGEFYEKRYFSSGQAIRGETMELGQQDVPFGCDLLFKASDQPSVVLALEVCEDLWAPVPPSTYSTMAGATIVANPSASNITVGKAQHRRAYLRSHSARCLCAYLYAGAGAGESTTDLAWDGHSMIFESGELLAENSRFSAHDQLRIADVDTDLLQQQRLRVSSFKDCAEYTDTPSPSRVIQFQISYQTQIASGLHRPLSRWPFLATSRSAMRIECDEVFEIQVQGLVTRLKSSAIEKVVVGVSGGLDSTLALLVCAKAMDVMGRPREGVLAYTLPGYATSRQTLKSAWALMRSLGVSAGEIDICDVSDVTLRDIAHPAANGARDYDVTYENVQAGARTAYLFRLANAHQAIVVGTGDLSELALGWCTYGVGDQMAHYNVNSSIPKTLVQQLLFHSASEDRFGPEVSSVLHTILAIEISPELVPGDGDAPAQRTEQLIGPYELHDFFLYYIVRFGFHPSKVAYLAWQAWNGSHDHGDTPARSVHKIYSLLEIRRWLRVFVQRFVGGSQFKRSAMPNGPKVTAGCSLSPRGCWRAPSDASATVWLRELDDKVPACDGSIVSESRKEPTHVV